MKTRKSGFTLIEMVSVVMVLGGMIVMSLGLLRQLDQQSNALKLHALSRGDWLRLANVWRAVAQQTEALGVEIDDDQVVLRVDKSRHVFRADTLRDQPTLHVIHYEVVADETSAPIRSDRFVIGGVGDLRFEQSDDKETARIVWASRSKNGGEIEIVGRLRQIAKPTADADEPDTQAPDANAPDANEAEQE